MNANFPAVLDANVLATFRVCDLLLRLAETPRLFNPLWSERILAEATKALTSFKTKPWPEEKARYFRSSVEKAFPEAMVRPNTELENILVNDPKDRHVLATAITGGACTIITFNIKDFKPEALAAWNVTAVHPSNYLITLFTINPAVVTGKLRDIAAKREVTLTKLLSDFQPYVPIFSRHVLDSDQVSQSD